MAGSKGEKLLQDQEVIHEVERYKWIESEKAGYDIGFDQAAENWLKLHAKAWEAQHPTLVKKPTRSARKLF